MLGRWAREHHRGACLNARAGCSVLEERRHEREDVAAYVAGFLAAREPDRHGVTHAG